MTPAEKAAEAFGLHYSFDGDCGEFSYMGDPTECVSPDNMVETSFLAGAKWYHEEAKKKQYVADICLACGTKHTYPTPYVHLEDLAALIEKRGDKAEVLATSPDGMFQEVLVHGKCPLIIKK